MKMDVDPRANWKGRKELKAVSPKRLKVEAAAAKG